MYVRDWMTRELVTVSPLDTVTHARRLMEARRVDQVPVVVDGKLMGILTLRDVRDALLGAAECGGRNDELLDLGRTAVETVMTPHVLTVEPGDTILYAAQLLRRERIGALPVVEGARLIGILTRADLLRALIELLPAEQSAGTQPSSQANYA